jgi:1-acyl-sn-glycerol-3-phosphate acyltransferase
MATTSDVYKLIEVWKAPELPQGISEEERRRFLEDMSLTSKEPFPPNVANKLCDMPFHEELIVALVWLAVFSMMLYGPFIVLFFLWWRPIGGIFVCVALSVISVFGPSAFSKTACFSQLATLMLKYFSFRGLWKDYPDPKKPYIYVGPPHGLFPFGSFLGMLAIPRFGGFYVRGIAASAVLKFPIVGNILRILGVVDASRANVKRYLEDGWMIGISSGGIAEIFETDTNAAAATECIILKSRGGICKMALQTGCDIIPGYAFGNSKPMSIWFDPFGIMSRLSRIFQVSLVVFSGN